MGKIQFFSLLTMYYNIVSGHQLGHKMKLGNSRSFVGRKLLKQIVHKLFGWGVHNNLLKSHGNQTVFGGSIIKCSLTNSPKLKAKYSRL